MIDLQQMSLALSLATRRSLLIIDELGKGTDSNGILTKVAAPAPDFQDGAGLTSGVLEHLLSLGSECPKVLGATHYHGRLPRKLRSAQNAELFECGLLAERPLLAFGHMEVRVDEAALASADRITYLYKSVACNRRD